MFPLESFVERKKMINSDSDPLLSKAGFNVEEDLLKGQAPMAIPFEIDLSQLTNTLRDEIKQATEPQQLQIIELKQLVKMLVDQPNANIMVLPHQQSLTNNELESGPMP